MRVKGSKGYQEGVRPKNWALKPQHTGSDRERGRQAILCSKQDKLFSCV